MSKPLFEVTVHVTQESCHALAKAKAGQHNHVILLSNLAIALGVTILWVVHSPAAIWLTILLGILVFQSVFGVRLTAMWMYAARNEAADNTRLSFDSEGISKRTRVEESRIPYDMVTGLREDSKYLMITMHHHTPLVMAKAEVPHGRADELAEFLKEKTGLEIRRFRK